MNIIFLTMAPTVSLYERGIYTDLLRCFKREGHAIFVVYPLERRMGKRTEEYVEDGTRFLAVASLNLQKSSVIEKGVGQLLLEIQFKQAIKRYWSKEVFDLILYSTPPITLIKTIAHLKKRNSKALTYLLLKDIFPQNAVDIGMMSKKGPKRLLYDFFRSKEKRLYRISDFIGCMSPANVEYVLTNNTEIDRKRVEVAPNSIEITSIDDNNGRNEIREKYGIPTNKPVLIYGGNLGKPQGIPFLISCLNANADREDCFFVVIGTGTEQTRLMQWYAEMKPKSVKVMEGLPRDEYYVVLRSCDVGMIFLDHRFSIPNYPSRLLSYLENKMPVICATDSNTDIGKIAEENGYGYWCESDSVEGFTSILDRMLNSDRKTMGENGFEFLKSNYLVDNTYRTIIKHLKDV